ncbi:GntR family transcriptional regulator [Peptoniphilus genitalis]
MVYRDLNEKIMKNKLLPGDKLIEMEIASKLDVSRTPVREALKKLEKDGLVRKRIRSYSVTASTVTSYSFSAS